MPAWQLPGQHPWRLAGWFARRAASFGTLVALLGIGATPPPPPVLVHAATRIDPQVSPLRTALRTSGTSVTPFMADAFADSFGINTRFGQGIYVSAQAFAERSLVELGFRHIRDGGVIDKPDVRAFLQGLCTKHGIHSSMGLNFNDTDAQIVAYIKDVPCVDMVEGPNETNGQANWVQQLATFMPHVYHLIRTTPAFNGIPVVAPSITKLEDGDLLSQTVDMSEYVDYGNKHSYPGQRNVGGSDGTGARGFGPSRTACPNYASGSYFYSVCSAQIVTKSRPIWTTETGYGSTPHGLASPVKHPPYGSIPYDVATKYFPRLMAYEFLNGISRTYIFALIDGASGCNGPFNTLGIVEQDCPNTGDPASLHIKPPFYALKNLMATVADPGPAFTTKPLTLKISGGDAKLQTLLLQKRDGRYLLLYWVEASDWDVDAGTSINVAPEPITISLGPGSVASVTDTTIDASTTLPKPQPLDAADRSVRVTASDMLHVLTFELR